MRSVATFHPTPLPRLALATLISALMAAAPPGSASAQQAEAAPGEGLAIQGLLPGNWYLSETPDPDPETVALECGTGMIMALGDGRWLGLVARPEATPPQITLDGRTVCDEGPKGAICTLEEPPFGDPDSTTRIFAEFDLTEAGHYWMRIQFLDDDETIEFYPQRCPGDALERLVIETFSAMP